MTIDQLKCCSEPCKVWVLGSISEIVWSSGWFFTSCAKCRKKVCVTDAMFFCEQCGDYVVGNNKYKIQVVVVDGVSNTTFVLWNTTVHKLLGTSAAELCQDLILDSIVPENVKDKYEGTTERPSAIEITKGTMEHPSVIEEKLTGKEMLFKVIVDNKNTDGISSMYSIDCVCDDIVLMDLHRPNRLNISDPSATDTCFDGSSKWYEELNADGFNGSSIASPDNMSVKRGVDDEIKDVVLDGEASVSSKKQRTQA